LGALAGVVDTGEDLGHCRDWRELEFDAAVVVTPPSTHYEIAKELLLAGKDVLVEKPMTLSVEEADDLIKTDRVLMVGHLLLYKSGVRKMLDCLDMIGDVQIINMRRAKYGTIRTDENVLWSFAPHDIAVLLKIISSPVAGVMSNSINLTGQDDDYHLHINFKNKAQAHIHVSWLWPEDERKTVIIGSKGALVYDENLNSLTINGQNIPFETNDALEEELQHFIDCVQGRLKPYTDGESGREVVRVLDT